MTGQDNSFGEVEEVLNARYVELVATRKQCRVCSQLTNPADCQGGIYDQDQIGPWSLWQGNLKANLLIVGQDWGDSRYFLSNKGRESASNPTNRTLRRLLASVGIAIPDPTINDSGGGLIFMTNAVLCLKEGGLQAKVQPDWFTNCGERFLRPTIELIAPKIVVSLGQRAFRAITSAYRLPKVSFKEAVGSPQGQPLSDGATCFPMYHCGARILNTHRSWEQQLNDWKRLLPAL